MRNVRGVDIGMLVMLSNEHVGVGKDLISSYGIACFEIHLSNIKYPD